MPRLKGLPHRSEIHPPDGIFLARHLWLRSGRHAQNSLRASIACFDVRVPNGPTRGEQLEHFRFLFGASPLQ
jgi:hypothetical protein